MIKMLLRCIATMGLLFALSTSQAQLKCPELPQEFNWQTAEDYRKDAELVKKTLRWLCSAPLNIDLSKRSEANVFVLKWLSGTPDYTIAIETAKLPFLEQHPELLDTFIHGMALGYLSKDKPIEQVDAYAAGFQAVVQVASQSKSLSKSRHLRPLFKAARKNELKKYAEKTLGKGK